MFSDVIRVEVLPRHPLPGEGNGLESGLGWASVPEVAFEDWYVGDTYRAGKPLFLLEFTKIL